MTQLWPYWPVWRWAGPALAYPAAPGWWADRVIGWRWLRPGTAAESEGSSVLRRRGETIDYWWLISEVWVIAVASHPPMLCWWCVSLWGVNSGASLSQLSQDQTPVSPLPQAPPSEPGWCLAPPPRSPELITCRHESDFQKWSHFTDTPY